MIVWSSALTVPSAAERVPVPFALPTAVTASPTEAVLVARSAGVRPDAFSSCSTATSFVAFVPTTSAV